ncbi:hypothetical protein LLH23_09685 [bacterium]|nr:hypothetical protein [bacterium]
MRTLFCLLAMCALSAALALQADLVRDGAGRVTQATVETQAYRLLLDVGKGARVMSLFDKAAQVELVQKDASGLGGLLEDRPIFSDSLYLCTATRNTPQELVLRCTVSKDGVSLVKTFTFTEGRPSFGVRYEIENATQLPFKLWVRNFANPGGGPLTEADHFFLRDGGKLLDLTFPDTYYKSLDAPWAAYLDAQQRSGFFVRCDFDLLDQFYCWSHSKVTPTFEWIYRPVPPGQRTSTSLVFGLITGLAGVGNVSADGQASAEAAAAAEPRQEPKLVAIPGWKPLEELYQPTAEERARGFIAVVSGVPAPAPRLTEVQMDVGLQEAEAAPVELFGLAEQAQVRATLAGLPVGVEVEEGGWLKANGGPPPTPSLKGGGNGNAPALQPGASLQPGAAVQVERGRSRRLWLKLGPQSLPPGVTQGTLTLTTGQGQPLVLPLQLTVWNAKLPEQPVIGTQFYASVPTLSSYTLDDAAKRKFITIMDNMQALHCDNLDWGVGPHSPAAHLKTAGTGQLLSDWGKQHPNTAADKLPDLDFSYFDVWFEEPVKRHMTRFVAHVPSGNGWREASLIGAALGTKTDTPDDEQGWAVMGWYYRQLRAYAERKGFTSFWAKLDDEIPQEHIPRWLEAARKYRAAGFRPFTTNTGNIARSESLLREMNRDSDAWQVALCLSRDFMDLTRKGAVFVTRRERISAKWGRYGNGGAVDTWATKVFGPERPAEKVDQVQVFVGGQALTMRGGSGWGNKDHGVAMQYGDYIYLSCPDGGDPNAANIEVSYRLRTLQEGGEPAVKLEPTDEVWYYGGGSYKTPYEAARAYPWRVVAWNMRGYGWWTYLWWNGEDILVKYRPETNDVLLSAAWEGLRDGNEDAAYFRLAEEKLAQAGRKDELARLRGVFGRDESAVLRLGEVKREIYAWDDFIAPTYAAYNTAKREALRVLAQ